jgi:hypothetical protein
MALLATRIRLLADLKASFLKRDVTIIKSKEIKSWAIVVALNKQGLSGVEWSGVMVTH